MENIEMTVRKDGKLEFVVDPKVQLRPSKTRVDAKGQTRGGDNMLVANSSGFQSLPVPGGYRLNMCIIKPLS